MKKHSVYTLIPVIIACFVIVSCSGNESVKMGKNSNKNIEFLGRSDCPQSPTMETNLNTALLQSGMKTNYEYVDLATLPAEDYRRGYGTPTVLINGVDLFGMARPMPTTATAPT